MEKIESGNEKILQTWNEYLDHLAVVISNLRMAYDMDIILGGDVGGVLSDYMIPPVSYTHLFLETCWHLQSYRHSKACLEHVSCLRTDKPDHLEDVF